MKRSVLPLIRAYTPRWASLQKLESSKIVSSSIVWFIAVPVLAKALSGVDRIVHIECLSARFPIQLVLPFSWTLFFFAATAFGAASGIVSWRRPRPLSEYSAVSEFVDADRSAAELVCDFLDVVECLRRPIGSSNSRGVGQLHEFLRAFEPQSLSVDLSQAKEVPPIEELSVGLRAARLRPGMSQEAQWLVWEIGNEARLFSRVVASLLYGVGCLLWTIVLSQNVLTVWVMSR